MVHDIKTRVAQNVSLFANGPWLSRSVVLFLLAAPLLAPDPYIVHILTLSLMYAVLAGSWNLLCGYAGIFSFGHQVFFGIGAYVSAIMAMRMGTSPWLGLLIGGGAAALISVVVALPCLRLRAAPYIAIATLGMAEISRVVAQNLVGLTRGELGLWGIPGLSDIALPLAGTISFTHNRIAYYYVMFVLFLLITGAIYWLIKSPFGIALKSIRESQDAAESLGVNVALYKIMVFIISAFFAGVVGSFYAHYILILTPSSVLIISVVVEIITITLIGGLGIIWGPIAGAFILTFSLEYLRFMGDYRLLIYGAILIMIILFMPEGFVRRIFPKRKLD